MVFDDCEAVGLGTILLLDRFGERCMTGAGMQTYRFYIGDMRSGQPRSLLVRLLYKPKLIPHPFFCYSQKRGIGGAKPPNTALYTFIPFFPLSKSYLVSFTTSYAAILAGSSSCITCRNSFLSFTKAPWNTLTSSSFFEFRNTRVSIRMGSC